VGLAGASGAAILAQALGSVPMRFTVAAIVFPGAAVLTGVILLSRRQGARFHEFARRLTVGAGWGVLATLAYDAIRPALMRIFRYGFDPYRAIGIFGQLMTGRPAGDPVATVAGWTYHFWNGISFGMVYALVHPGGGAVSGLAWAMVLQGLMMAVYPALLGARLADPGFLTSGLVGHALWGVILGAGVRRSGSPGRGRPGGSPGGEPGRPGPAPPKVNP
jgi:hypothetical protein